jgi:hypothetical protein
MFVAQFANGLCNVLFEEFIVQIRGTSLFFWIYLLQWQFS